MATKRNRVLDVEQRSIDHIPATERHGSPKGLFAVWSGANMQFTTVVTGALGPAIGLSLPWTLVAITAGNLVGAIFMALHSAQGPRLGIPQMIQSRAQFGFYGAILPILLVLLMYVGFFASSGVLGGDAVSVQAGIGPAWGIIIVAGICVTITIFGYRLIHRLERISSILSGLAFIYLTARLLTAHNLQGIWRLTHPSPGPLLLMVAIAATWQLSYAPYVADYSRYLPVDTSIRACFWWTYGGSVFASVWMMAFGAFAAVLAPGSFNGGSTSFAIGLGPAGTRWIFAAIIALGVIAVNVLNLYGAFMSFTTTVTAIKPFNVRPAVRIAIVLTIGVAGTALAIVGRNSFMTAYENFILFLTYLLVPWTAINLIDFYAIRKEHYNIAAIFTPTGQYGAVRWSAVGAYLLGIAVEIPFMNTSFYTGPLVADLDGADISWILGLIASGTAYYLAMRSQRTLTSQEPADAGRHKEEESYGSAS